VPENRALMRIFGPKKDKTNGDWRNLHNEFHNFSPSIIRMIKSRRMRLARHVAGTEEKNE
jgi:hypothetical protein